MPAGKQAQFSSKWFLIHPNSEYSIVKNVAFCFVCSLFRKPTVEEAWSISGASAWHKMKSKWKRRRKLSGYFTSQEHGNSFKDYARFCDPLCRVDVMLGILTFQISLLVGLKKKSIIIQICSDAYIYSFIKWILSGYYYYYTHDYTHITLHTYYSIHMISYILLYTLLLLLLLLLLLY